MQEKYKKKIKKKTISFFLRFILKEKFTFYLIIVLLILVNIISNVANVIIPKLLIDELLIQKRFNFTIILMIVTIMINCIMPILKKMLIEYKNVISDMLTRKLDLKLNCKMMELDYIQVEDREIQSRCYKAKEAIGKASGGLQSISENFVSLVSWFFTGVVVTSIVFVNAPIIFSLLILCVVLSFYINRRINYEEINFFRNQHP